MERLEKKFFDGGFIYIGLPEKLMIVNKIWSNKTMAQKEYQNFMLNLAKALGNVLYDFYIKLISEEANISKYQIKKADLDEKVLFIAYKIAKGECEPNEALKVKPDEEVYVWRNI